MKIKLTATTTWMVNPNDLEMANKLLKEQPGDAILGYLLDAEAGDISLSTPTITATEVLEDLQEEEP